MANSVPYGDQICETRNSSIDFACDKIEEQASCLSQNETCQWVYNGQVTPSWDLTNGRLEMWHFWPSGHPVPAAGWPRLHLHLRLSSPCFRPSAGQVQQAPPHRNRFKPDNLTFNSIFNLIWTFTQSKLFGNDENVFWLRQELKESQRPSVRVAQTCIEQSIFIYLAQRAIKQSGSTQKALREHSEH